MCRTEHTSHTHLLPDMQVEEEAEEDEEAGTSISTHAGAGDVVHVVVVAVAATTGRCRKAAMTER